MYKADCDPGSINAPTTYYGNPRCPLCGKVMRLTSNRRGETLWECTNLKWGKDGYLVCPLIEGRFDRRSGRLWGIRYETRPAQPE